MILCGLHVRLNKTKLQCNVDAQFNGPTQLYTQTLQITSALPNYIEFNEKQISNFFFYLFHFNLLFNHNETVKIKKKNCHCVGRYDRKAGARCRSEKNRLVKLGLDDPTTVGRLF